VSRSGLIDILDGGFRAYWRNPVLCVPPLLSTLLCFLVVLSHPLSTYLVYLRFGSNAGFFWAALMALPVFVLIYLLSSFFQVSSISMSEDAFHGKSVEIGQIFCFRGLALMHLSIYNVVIGSLVLVFGFFLLAVQMMIAIDALTVFSFGVGSLLFLRHISLCCLGGLGFLALAHHITSSKGT